MTSVQAIGMIVFVWLYSLLVSGLRFFLPLFIMIVMYVKIYLVARKQVLLLRRVRSYARDVKVAKKIALLIGLFFICGGPFFAIILCFAYDQSCPVPSSLFNLFTLSLIAVIEEPFVNLASLYAKVVTNPSLMQDLS
ncbi:unnamed protein product [Pocillopora meandrina]|uniref:G-protein coupled receptors family 1 profile domain-containing protein n=1 Tax=Pocillopora meandrina TaxID=46732 RepID=A0AAU9XAI7_9CNID|nr:unnamed protein product [Pocillopora meandrina]